MDGGFVIIKGQLRYIYYSEVASTIELCPTKEFRNRLEQVRMDGKRKTPACSAVRAGEGRSTLPDKTIGILVTGQTQTRVTDYLWEG
jgi:hypothetical protein